MGSIVDADAGLCSLLGYSVAELLRRNLADIIQLDDRSTLPMQLILHEQVASYSRDAVVRCKNGRLLQFYLTWMQVTPDHAPRKNGAVLGMSAHTTPQADVRRPLLSAVAALVLLEQDLPQAHNHPLVEIAHRNISMALSLLENKSADDKAVFLTNSTSSVAPAIHQT